MKRDYDLVVIGAGPGGYEAAVEASKNGMKVAIVEAKYLGGTCLNTGCMATKTILHTTDLFGKLSKEASMIGLRFEEISCDMDKVQERKREVIEQLQQAILALMKANKIDVFTGFGKLSAPHELTIKSEEGTKKITSTFFLLTTGSKASTLPLKGIEYTINSDKILNSNKVYKNLVIIGGGVIGMEFASIYKALGTRVTVIEACDRILSNMDKDISQSLKMQFAKQGVTFHTKANVTEIVPNGDIKTCKFIVKDKEMSVDADEILVSVGRVPNVENLWADEMALEMNGRAIAVNKNYQTSIDYIYAAGDVIGGIQLAHVATAEAQNAIYHMLGKIRKYDTTIVPSCIYTDPEIASVGLTSDDAKKNKINAKIYKLPMTSNGKTLIANGERGFIKIVADADSQIILGAQLMCERATDMISQLTLAVQYKMTVKQLESIIYPHPTFNEAIGKALS